MWRTLENTTHSNWHKLKQSAWVILGGAALFGFGQMSDWLAPASWAAGLACLSQLDHIWRQ